MFDVSKLCKRYFTVKLIKLLDDDTEKEITLNVEPPKLKALRKITEVSVSKDFGDLTNGLCTILSKNKEHFKLSVDDLEDCLDFDEMQLLMTEYFEWLSKSKSSKN